MGMHSVFYYILILLALIASFSSTQVIAEFEIKRKLGPLPVPPPPPKFARGPASGCTGCIENGN
ncbi:hypothetical protein DEO72_LG2g5765 [Vigna unguiculata]|uniref:Transmembrane protein n=1 Tax=Vigna unguiculata TaxID=3917 RepID=A0A4D6LAM0_VIGUN|nr:hypothetical protein DEO72_LG2g5765 [Vigna unguiculata]